MSGEALAGDGRGALTDHDAPARSRRCAGGPRTAVGIVSGPSDARPGDRRRSTDLAPQRLAQRPRRLADLLQQEVRVGAAVDVTGGDLRDLRHRHGSRAARVPSYDRRVMPSSEPARSPSSTNDLAATGVGVRGIGRRLAVEPQVRPRSPRRARRARWRRRTRPRRDRRRAPDHCRVGRAADGAGRLRDPCSDRDRSLEASRRSRGTLRPARRPRRLGRDHHRDHLCVGGDLDRDAQSLRCLQVGMVVDVAVECRHHIGSAVVDAALCVAVQRVRVRLPDDARRWPIACARARSPARVGRQARAATARRSMTASRRTRVLSPSSPISAAAL